MSRKKRNLLRRVNTIICKLQALKDAADIDPELRDLPDGLEAFQQACIGWYANNDDS